MYLQPKTMPAHIPHQQIQFVFFAIRSFLFAVQPHHLNINDLLVLRPVQQPIQQTDQNLLVVLAPKNSFEDNVLLGIESAFAVLH